MLSMHAQNRKLVHGVSKLNDKVLSLQNQLMQKEEEVNNTSAKFSYQLSSAECKIEERDKKIRDMKRDPKVTTNKLFTTSENLSSNLKLLSGSAFSKKTVSLLRGEGGKIKRTVKSEANNCEPTSKSAAAGISGYCKNIVSTATSMNAKPVETNTQTSDNDTAAENSVSSEEGSIKPNEDADTSSGKAATWLESGRSAFETNFKKSISQLTTPTSKNVTLVDSNTKALDKDNVIEDSVSSKGAIIELVEDADTSSGTSANWLESGRSAFETISKKGILQLTKG